MSKDVIKVNIRQRERTTEQVMDDKVETAVGNMGVAHDYTSWNPVSGDYHGKGTVITTGVVVGELAQAMVIRDDNDNPDFVAGTLVYVDSDSPDDGETLVPLKTEAGVEIGVSVKICPAREATVEEAMIKMKADIAAEQAAEQSNDSTPAESTDNNG